MSKLREFVRLDFLTVKPYMTLKNLIICTAVAIFMAFTSASPSAAVSLLMVFGTIYATYPFAAGEKSGLDALYATLSVKRGTVVLGRYLFAQIFLALAGFFALFLSVAVLQFKGGVYGSAMNEAFITAIAMFLLCGILQAVQLPMIFKMGYIKSRLFANLPLIALGLMGMLVLLMFNDDDVNLSNIFGRIEAYPLAVVGIAVAAWLVCMFVSYKLSLAFYKKREF
ncbi:MAG: ABC-2 transporter permease [Oscillospiraceae bacterium]|nr:ABC-2 transporter permease [Oscillospiraceae bacterium]